MPSFHTSWSRSQRSRRLFPCRGAVEGEEESTRRALSPATPAGKKKKTLLGQLERPKLTPLQERAVNFRRLLVLCGVAMKMHVRNEKDFEEDLIKMGLATTQELEIMTGHSKDSPDAPTMRGSSYSLRDGKHDRFPSKNRPAFVLMLLHRELADLFRAGHTMSPNHQLAVDDELNAIAAAFESCSV